MKNQRQRRRLQRDGDPRSKRVAHKPAVWDNPVPPFEPRPYARHTPEPTTFTKINGRALCAALAVAVTVDADSVLRGDSRAFANRRA
jgi:hypothetical protein